jgi:tetratricopeptide (TPR) repeat protein
MRYVANTIALLLIALSLASCTSTTTTLYSGEMELVAISGSGCSEKDKIGSIFPLELTLEQGRATNGQPISGYFYGPGIESGRFFGNDSGRLQVVYPDEPGSTTQGHTLRLSPSPEGATGELHEKPPLDSTNCYFDKAVLKLKLEAAGSKAESEYDRLSKLFSANAYYKNGLSLLKVDKPEEALRDLTKSLNLRTMVNPNDPDRAYPAVSMAIAHIMAGREAEALTILRKLLGKKTETGNAIVKQRLVVIDSLCSNVQYLEDDAGRKAATQLMDIAAREFGSLNGVAVPLAACYDELGKEGREQDDPDLALEFFQKALKLHPGDPDSITGVVASLVDKKAPAEGRKYLQAHAQIFMEKASKESYAILLSYLYDAEAQQAYNSGDLLRAEQLSREALKVRPGERALIINLARVLGKTGKNAEARRLLEDGSKGCSDEPCRQEYADGLARQDLIELMVKRLESQKVGRGTPHH